MSRHKHKSSYRKSETSLSKISETNLCDFSFAKNKQIFERFLIGFHSNEEIISNLPDFWAFVDKYERMLKSAAKPILPHPLKLEAERKLNSYHKSLFISIDIDIDKQRAIDYISSYKETPSCFPYKAEQFLEIVLLYLDFKQKERFQKLRKLRKTQKSLPVYGYKEDITTRVKNHQVVILAGDTGCGKSTQIPQYLHQIGYKNIACTQPRRLACISLSKRVAYEMLDNYGCKVGYKIRFEKSTTTKTQICFITEGLLLRQLALDANLYHYDVLILDEVHERNLHGDILLGVVKCLIKARPELKLILMSATINVELLNKYFEDENVSYIEIPGRLYPIKMFYMPPQANEIKNLSGKSKKSTRIDPEPFVQILSLIDSKYPRTEKGDLLMFLSGVNEITTVIDAAKQYNETIKSWIILPLHSGLSLGEQDKVFDYAPEGMRKCIVSTNIAETSLTIDGIRFVADSGKVKEMNFDSTGRIQRLKEFWVSKSSAEQRKGRAGRTGPGICYRLYTQKDFDNFEDYPVPEIHRVPLESILLQMVAMGLPNVRVFPFIEPPAKENIELSVISLKQHEALTADEKITPLGKALSALPVEISIGKMLLMSSVFRELSRALTFAAIMSIQSPYTTRAFTDGRCERERESLESDHGDPFTTINIFREWLELKWSKKENTKKWCYSMGVEEQRFYELTKLRNQFENVLESCNIIGTRSEEFSSTTERSIRYGEIRMLKAFKRAQRMEAPTNRKILKFDAEDHEQFDDTLDIRDVDFRLKNDTGQMKSLLKSANAQKYKDVLMLKLIIVSGFYPQIAIPDEFNFCQTENQQFFHTMSKQFVCLHPNSDFAKHWDVLRVKEVDTIEKPVYYISRLQLSAAHQVLCYQNLLETTKSYLLNTIRLQAAPTLLLFSFAIDTDSFVTRIVCDQWLSFEFPVPGSGQTMLLKAIRLRRIWRKLVAEKINDQKESENETNKFDYDQDKLLDELISFMNTNVVYTIKRLLPADLKDLYSHSELSPELFIPNPFAPDFEVTANLEKGGLNVTENVVYNCLKETPWSIVMQEHIGDFSIQCDVCDGMIIPIEISRILHTTTCQPKEEIKPEKPFEVASTSAKNLKKYFCSICKRDLFLSSLEILKHKNRCTEKNAVEIKIEKV